KNSYIVYVSYIASLISSLGGFGIPATTRKYMAEYIGMGDRGTARIIYFRTLQLQTALATLATGGLLYWVLGDANPDYKVAAALLMLSMWFGMINSISAQANSAAENLAANMPASVISIFVYLIVIVATVVLNWGVVGVGAATLSMRFIDCLVRFFPTMNRVLAWETTDTLPPELRKRMIAYAWQSVSSMAVALIVWGRSEILLLEKFCPDVRQVTFYSVSFSMADQLLILATIFGSAVSVTVFVQYGRNKARLPAIAASAFRYLALITIPLQLIFASLAYPALLLLYGHKFQDAATVVFLAPLLCMFKAYLAPAQSLLECSERQKYVIATTAFAGIVDWGVAWWLIPAHGAVGACIGNGAAQAAAVLMMWAVAIHLYKVKLPWLQVAKIVFISLLAAMTAHFIAVRLAPLWAILFGGCASLIVLFGLFYWMRVLEPEDHSRLKILITMLPKQLAIPADSFLNAMIRL
ncbi:MAG: polysaccharide biosynthesis C-terminal domain-containing protein, partial [Terracidiphilus sp.]